MLVGTTLFVLLVGGALYYAKSGPQTSAFGMPVGQIPDVFGVGRRALRRSNRRADIKSHA